MDTLSFLPVEDWVNHLGLDADDAVWMRMSIWIVLVGIIAILSDIFAKRIFLGIVKRVVLKSKTEWDDILLKRKVFTRLAHLAPAMVVYAFATLMFGEFSVHLVQIVKGGASIYMLIIIILVINAFLNGVQDIYNSYEISKDKPITGFVQVAKIIIYAIIIISIIAILIGKSPVILFTGLGAMAAVLILVFKDTILGFVASIQMSANDMVRPGDWISMPKHNADGTVLEITLNTVKVQNWDKTIATVPTYALVADSFNNWRGMEESGGRRIKRSLFLDVNSVKFCSDDLLAKLSKNELLSDYITNKMAELASSQKNPEDVFARTRRLTNIGVFRIYMERYLKVHPNINREMTFLIRQLQPSEKGLPMEIYVFSAVQAWAHYEAIQADIFDHFLAFIPEFELKVFQNPTGEDFRALGS